MTFELIRGVELDIGIQDDHLLRPLADQRVPGLLPARIDCQILSV